MGFDYFYGFIGGDTSQWEPGNLFRNTTPIYPYVGHPGWNLESAEADDAINWLNRMNDIDPKMPFLIYFVPGGTHAPYDPTPITGIPRGTAPDLLDTSYSIRAEITVPKDDADGVIVTDGGSFGGYGLYLLKSRPVFLWNLRDLKRVRWEGAGVLSPGKHTLEFDFKYDGLGLATLAYNNFSGIGRGGTGVFTVDGKVVATHELKRTIPLIMPWDETFDIGSDTGTPVDDQDYHVPFKFTGKIDKLAFKVKPPVLTPQDKARLLSAERSAADQQ